MGLKLVGMLILLSSQPSFSGCIESDMINAVMEKLNSLFEKPSKDSGVSAEEFLEKKMEGVLEAVDQIDYAFATNRQHLTKAPELMEAKHTAIHVLRQHGMEWIESHHLHLVDPMYQNVISVSHHSDYAEPVVDKVMQEAFRFPSGRLRPASVTALKRN